MHTLNVDGNLNYKEFKSLLIYKLFIKATLNTVSKEHPTELASEHN